MVICLQFFLQDTKSSNGTFVNNQRLSKSSEESPPREVCSGDIVQFGVDVMELNKKCKCVSVQGNVLVSSVEKITDLLWF